jgi:hypothetical protein
VVGWSSGRVVEWRNGRMGEWPLNGKKERFTPPPVLKEALERMPNGEVAQGGGGWKSSRA